MFLCMDNKCPHNGPLSNGLSDEGTALDIASLGFIVINGSGVKSDL